jgi:transcriptional regulator with XRE-family HTH domain
MADSMSSMIDTSDKDGRAPTLFSMPTKGPPELAVLLNALVRRIGTTRAVAEKIGLSEGRVGRIQRGEGSMEIANLLMLAELADEPPSAVLRLAGKAKEAELIERLYGISAPPMTSSHRALLELWDRLPERGREHFRALMREVVAQSGGKRRVG